MVSTRRFPNWTALSEPHGSLFRESVPLSRFPRLRAFRAGLGLTRLAEALDEIGEGRVDARSGQILLDAGQDLTTSRQDARKTYARAREAARDQGSLVVDARCDYCEFSLLCGMRGDVS